MTFLDKLNESLRTKWKFKQPMPIQTLMIPEMLAGKDIVAESPTGTGKTLAYVLPLIQMVNGDLPKTQALIITPSQELSMQIVNVIRDLVEGTSVTVTQLIGGANMQRQIEKLKKKPTIVVGTPGRLNELVKERKLKMYDVHYVVIDEGDQLLSREYRVMVKSLIEAANPEHQLAVVSATITEEIELVAKRMMKDPIRLQVNADEIPESGHVVHSYIKVDDRKKTDVLRGISALSGVRALTFMNNVDQLRMKELKLLYNDAPIAVLYSDMKKFDRQKTLEDFREGKIRVLIATDLAARGLDIEGLTHVIHVDVPHTVEQYLHRSGRTGRAGADGEVLTLLSYAEERDYRKVTKGIKTVQKVWYSGNLVEGNAKTVEEMKKAAPKTKKSKPKQKKN
ncbi:MULTISPECIES: DEAD/DEAH box helicase [Sporosarcina]|uniref:Superfamily II DNA and RNA helicase n=2 Tax=Sporosarcina newyorkensis TaxID=759851 RepID=A0A1T4YR01_9BACL|nr:MULTISPECIES: DEAD/DEAH box helicase [Sporosarcina]EGQ26171.1 ATP-dependent RNA helicase DeaD [Sporosarcina newyorkensis 2681]MBY0223060.1 DEAD/DEAH box helicase [Sporosarcina aquimarina]SKB04267.1 Superfamily II DNA and RNA helicase [Sporosarcina newyorkensis]